MINQRKVEKSNVCKICNRKSKKLEERLKNLKCVSEKHVLFAERQKTYR